MYYYNNHYFIIKIVSTHIQIEGTNNAHFLHTYIFHSNFLVFRRLKGT